MHALLGGGRSRTSPLRPLSFVPASAGADRGEHLGLDGGGDHADEVTAAWSTPTQGGTVLVDRGPSQSSPLYGMAVDRFGVTLVLDVAVAREG